MADVTIACPHCGARQIPEVPGITYCTACGKAVVILPPPR